LHLPLPPVQVLTIHSPFSVENATSHPLQLALHLQRGEPARFGGGGGGGGGGARAGGAVCAVPAAGALAPGEQCFLPLPAVWCARLLCEMLLNVQHCARQHLCMPAT
jgi:hypothetical protein